MSIQAANMMMCCGDERYELPSRVEHQLFCAIKPEQGPTAIVPGLRCLGDLETEHVAVEPDRSGHVEDLKQRADASNINGHLVLLFGGETPRLSCGPRGATLALPCKRRDTRIRHAAHPRRPLTDI